MDINSVLNELDKLFAANELDKIDDFLTRQYEIAKAEEDYGAQLSLLNELIGYYREMTWYDKAQEVVRDTLALLGRKDFAGEIEEGTSLLNIANVYRAMGRFEESEEYYKAVEKIYREKLEAQDFRFASLYNNASLLYQAQERFDLAAESLLSALEIVKKHPEAEIELAVTYTNLGQVYMRLSENEKAEDYLMKAQSIFEKTDKKDYHYCGCANALGALYFMTGDYKKSVYFYEEALLNMYETAGITENYQAIRENLMMAYEKAGVKTYDNMLDLCQAYYETYGKPMIHEKFAAYEDKIAVGLCGEGSECFGFDDEISMDHDCGPGFAMWVSDEVYEQIGIQLSEEYNKLPRLFAGRIRLVTGIGSRRCGVCTIKGFYVRVLGGKPIPQSENDWHQMDEYALAAATNGRVFVDKEGAFSEIRGKLLEYYPHNVWIERIARSLLWCAQAGQYNYGRMMARADYVTAHIALSEYMKGIMDLVFLLNKKYAPYYKWQHKAMASLEILPEVGDILTAIGDMESQRAAWKDYQYRTEVNPNDMIAMTIEIVAKLVVNCLHEMGLSKSNDLYLEAQAMEVYKLLKEDVSNV